MLFASPMVLLQYAPLVLLAALLVQIVRLKANKLFPWFFAYVCFAVIAGAARFLMRNHAHSYLVIYWTTEAGYNALHLLAIYEVYRTVFRGLARIWWFHLIFPCTLIVAISLLAVHIKYTPLQTSNRLFAVIITSDLGVQLLQALVFVVLVACVALLQLRWRQYAFGITAGFGLYATVALIAITKISVFVTSSTIVWGWILVAAYTGAVLTWLWFFRKPQKPESLGVSEESILRAKHELELYLDLIRRIRDL